MFAYPQPVLFKHCDPAGIVFYPRYFEMINDVVEAFFADIGTPFHHLHPAAAVPTAHIEADFPAPSRHGDQLDFELTVARVGRSSATLDLIARCDDQPRLTACATLVYITDTPTPWPDHLRAALAFHMKEPT